MKVACIFLTLDRVDLTLRSIKQNFFNSGLDADVFLIDNGSTPENFEAIVSAYPHFKMIYHFTTNQGIAAAINKGLALTKKYDAVVTLANDILMPAGWLNAMVNNIRPGAGMIGIHCVENLAPLVDGVHPADPVFGNVLITRAALKKVGKYNEAFDPYGMQDADFGYRVRQAGFLSYYLPNLKSEHIGHDAGGGGEYRKMKDESLARANEIWTAARKRYDETGNYYL